MPWEKQFDINETLEKAMNLFWQQGYEATSMQNLVEHMSVNPGSLYATYGNKRELFLKAISHYISIFDKCFKNFEKTKEPKEAILSLFNQIVKDAKSKPKQSGCLIVNSALEVAPYDKEVERLVQKGFGKTRLFFKKRIEAGQASGTIPLAFNANEKSQLLLGVMIAMRVVSRGQKSSAALLTMKNHAEELLQ